MSRYTLEGVQLLNYHWEYTFRIQEVAILKDGVEKSLFVFLILTIFFSSLHSFSINLSLDMCVWKAK